MKAQVKIKPPKWENKTWPESICLQRDSLDLYIDGEIYDTAPISYEGMKRLKSLVDDKMNSGVLFQIKIRGRVQWESVPTKLEVDPATLFNYETSVF